MNPLVRAPLDVARLAVRVTLAPTRLALRVAGLGGAPRRPDGATAATPAPARPLRPEARATPPVDAALQDAGLRTDDAPPPAGQEVPLPEPQAPPRHVDEEVEQVASFGPADDVGATIEIEPPFRGYDELSAREVVERLRDADATTRAAVELYEAAHKKRATVLTAARG
jgi:hypothetical protein